MTETMTLVAAGLWGGVLGAIFFGGLWWTIRRGLSSEYAGVWFLISLLVRTSIALAGFYVVARNDWREVVAALVGFVLARAVTAYAIRRAER